VQAVALRVLVERRRRMMDEKELLALTGPAYRLALRILRSPEDAEDAVQQACLAAVRQLRSGSPPERVAAANTLWGMGTRARAAVPDLAFALEDPDAGLRVTAAMALENMGPAAEPAVASLTKAVRDRDAKVRQAAVKALGAIGPGAKAALPTLTRALRRGSWPEAEEAVRRIRGLEPGAVIELGPVEPGEPEEP